MPRTVAEINFFSTPKGPMRMVRVRDVALTNLGKAYQARP
jgi:hypothetical protein